MVRIQGRFPALGCGQSPCLPSNYIFPLRGRKPLISLEPCVTPPVAYMGWSFMSTRTAEGKMVTERSHTKESHTGSMDDMVRLSKDLLQGLSRKSNVSGEYKRSYTVSTPDLRWLVYLDNAWAQRTAETGVTCTVQLTAFYRLPSARHFLFWSPANNCIWQGDKPTQFAPEVAVYLFCNQSRSCAVWKGMLHLLDTKIKSRVLSELPLCVIVYFGVQAVA